MEKGKMLTEKLNKIANFSSNEIEGKKLIN